MNLEIITPEQKLYAGIVKEVQVPGVDGLLGILDNHAPLISTLKEGVVKVKDAKGVENRFDIAGGVVEVLNNKVIILAE